MRVDSGMYAATVDQAAGAAVDAEARGYDGWSALETQVDPFIASAVAAERTERLQIATGIAVAFARNPMTVAVQANDLQALSGGRFALGLGSQIKPHITKRFSMPWSSPAARMREFVLAVRAIWRTWETGEPLAFRGDFYTHTLMTPFFDPGPNPHGNPRILMAAVGPLMTEAAGEVADGILCHAFTTPRYIREVTVPRLLRGREQAGRDDLDGFDVVAPLMFAAGDTEEEIAASLAGVKQQIGFYGSTPGYRAVLDLHGWGDLHVELNELSKRAEWARMPEIIPDEVIDAIAVVGTPEEAIAEVQRRYGGLATRVGITLPATADPERWRPLFDQLRAG
jgi:probable F420-dependent oxidoreductase